MCICVQHIGPNAIPVRNYQIACCSPTSDGRLGTAIYVHNRLSFKVLTPSVHQYPYQMTAIELFLPDSNKITICNIYNQPDFNSNFEDLPQLVNNFSHPVLLVGDFNAHHPLWDELHNVDSKGVNIESFILNSNFCCLNENDCPTYFSNTHNIFSSVDVSLCTADIVEKFEWEVCEDSYSSDHFPVILKYLGNPAIPTPPRYR